MSLSRTTRHVRSVVVLGIFATLATGSNGGGNSRSGDALTNMAFIICKDFVKARLRAPASADFPFMDFESKVIGTNEYSVRSYVDAQNAFGAQLRQNWSCRVRYNGGEDADPSNWTLLDLAIDE